MTKPELEAAVAEVRERTRAALQTVYDALNQGQQKKLVKDDEVRRLFDLYGVAYET